MSVQISELLYSSPDIRKGRPCVVGTRTTVHRIAVWWKMGESAEEIAESFPHLSLAGVHAALAYYHANREEIDAEIAAEQAEEDRLEAEWLKMRNTQTA